MSSITQDAYRPGFFETANEFVNHAIETVTQKYQELEDSQPKVIAIAKKVLPIALLIISLFISPIFTLIGIGVGLAFSKQIEPVLEKIQGSIVEGFKNTNLLGKILMAVGAACIGMCLPMSVQGLMMGVSGGLHITKSLQGIALPERV